MEMAQYYKYYKYKMGSTLSIFGPLTPSTCTIHYWPIQPIPSHREMTLHYRWLRAAFKPSSTVIRFLVSNYLLSQ